jgi:hypothetical protein
MVFPTIHTLRTLTGFDSAAAAIGSFRTREIPVILPRLVKTPTGVGIRVDG